MPLANTQYDIIMREYSRKQIKNKHRQTIRTAQIYREIPEVKVIEEEIAQLALAQARKLLAGDASALSILKGKLNDLRDQKSILLLDRGYSADYMSEQYDCPDCKDTGYVGNKKCHCFKQAAIRLLYSQSNLKEILEKENFDTFSYKWYSKEPSQNRASPYENIQKIVQHCMELIENFEHDKTNLLFTGPAGVGKTFLTHCIAKALLDRYYSVIYLSSNELFDLLSKQKFDPQSQEEVSSKYQYILSCDLLIIDDLGTELTNTFTTSQLFYCINERISAGVSTIISTNLSLKTMRDFYTERITSRLLSHYKILELYGEDIRIKKIISSP